MVVVESFEENVHLALRQVIHPETNHSLVDLGMIKNVIVKGEYVAFTLVLPFLNVPIKEDLVRRIKEAIKKLNADANIEVRFTEMSEEERVRFITMARNAWIR